VLGVDLEHVDERDDVLIGSDHRLGSHRSRL
jgi:hypothetical protein